MRFKILLLATCITQILGVPAASANESISRQIMQLNSMLRSMNLGLETRINAIAIRLDSTENDVNNIMTCQNENMMYSPQSSSSDTNGCLAITSVPQPKTWNTFSGFAVNTPYQNTHSYPIHVSVTCGSGSFLVSSDNVTWVEIGREVGGGDNLRGSYEVPANHYWRVTGGGCWVVSILE